MRSGLKLRLSSPIKHGPMIWLLLCFVCSHLQRSLPKHLNDCATTSSALLRKLMLSEDPTETPSKEDVSFLIDCVIAKDSAAQQEGLPSFPDVHLMPDVQHEALMALAVSLRSLEAAPPSCLNAQIKHHRGRYFHFAFQHCPDVSHPARLQLFTHPVTVKACPHSTRMHMCV